MKNKKPLLLFLFIILITIMLLLPGCKEGKEQEAIDLLNTMFPESTPTPTPTPTPDTRHGMLFSDEVVDQLYAQYPASNTSIDIFEYPYIIYADNDVSNDCSYYTVEFNPPLSLPEIQEHFGQILFDLTIDGMSHSCKFVGETDKNGNPLDVALNIDEKTDGYTVYIRFGPNEPLQIVDNIFDIYWPADGLIDDSLTDDMLYYKGIIYDPDTQDSTMYLLWQLEKEEFSRIMQNYILKLSGYSDYDYTPGSEIVAPVIGVTLHSNENEKQTCTITAESLKEDCLSLLSLVVRTRRVY